MATISQTGKNNVFFSEIVTHITVGFFPRKMMVCGWNLPDLDVNGIRKW